MQPEILHLYNEMYGIAYEAPKKVEIEVMKAVGEFNSKISKTFRKISKGLFVVGILIFLVGMAPTIYGEYSKGTSYISSLILNTAQNDEPSSFPARVLKPDYYPPIDPKLSVQNILKIPSAGINTVINESPDENYEEALKKGVWRVPEFSQPFDLNKSVILAAHRFGYLSWSIPYRLKNSFFNLPSAKVGDIVEIDWNQRRYIYEIYAEGKGDKITDYKADLILYTCEALNSNVRIFKYAKLIEI
ncbi:sortase [Candidatus Woesebacteria bacterium]|nr:sortase [Candidatus Woesebacteria bacterium]